MGQPYLNSSDFVNAGFLDTTAWAFDPVTHEKWPQYRTAPNLTSPLESVNTHTLLVDIVKHDLSPLLDYRNPFAIYDSAVMHTATITGLVPGTQYFYKVNGSCHTYNFTFPKNEYPFKVGKESMSALIALLYI